MSRIKGGRRALGPPVTWETFRELTREFPGVEEGISWGTPSLKARGKMLARHREGGETLVLSIEQDARAVLVETDPEADFYTDHYENYPAMLIRLNAIRIDDLKELIENVWRELAPRHIVAAYDFQCDH